MRVPKLSIVNDRTITIKIMEPERSINSKTDESEITNIAKAKTALGTAWGRKAIKSKISLKRLRLRRTIQEKTRLIARAMAGETIIRMSVFFNPIKTSDQSRRMKLRKDTLAKEVTDGAWKYGSKEAHIIISNGMILDARI